MMQLGTVGPYAISASPPSTAGRFVKLDTMALPRELSAIEARALAALLVTAAKEIERARGKDPR
jgi:hypothetical protein